MNYAEVKAAMADEALYLYSAVTQQEIADCPVNNWAIQSNGTWYLGTTVPVSALAGKLMTP